MSPAELETLRVECAKERGFKNIVRYGDDSYGLIAGVGDHGPFGRRLPTGLYESIPPIDYNSIMPEIQKLGGVEFALFRLNLYENWKIETKAAPSLIFAPVYLLALAWLKTKQKGRE